jgi:hypothetical protein
MHIVELSGVSKWQHVTSDFEEPCHPKKKLICFANSMANNKQSSIL